MKNTLVYQKGSNTIRQMPQNYLVAHKSPVHLGWVCDPDMAADFELTTKVFSALRVFENKYATGPELLKSIEFKNESLNKVFYWVKYEDKVIIAERVYDPDGVDFWLATGSNQTIYDDEVYVLKGVEAVENRKEGTFQVVSFTKNELPEVYKWVKENLSPVYEDIQDVKEHLYSTDIEYYSEILDIKLPDFIKSFLTFQSHQNFTYFRFEEI